MALILPFQCSYLTIVDGIIIQKESEHHFSFHEKRHVKLSVLYRHFDKFSPALPFQEAYLLVGAIFA